MLEEIAKRMGKVKCEMERKDMCKVLWHAHLASLCTTSMLFSLCYRDLLL